VSPSTTTTLPDPSITTPYDPDFCGSSWISWVNADILELLRWATLYAQESSWRGKHEITSWSDKSRDAGGRLHLSTAQWVTVTNIVTSTIWKNVSTQCDGLPPVTSASETTYTSLESWNVTFLMTDYYNATPSTTLPRPWGREVTPKPPAHPACEIHPDQCQKQWDRLQAFNFNSSKYMDAIGWTEEVDISGWVLRRGYTYTRGFFSGCRQPADLCVRAVLGNDSTLSSEPLRTSSSTEWDTMFTPSPLQEVLLGCQISGERFVLIYFPPPGNAPRNLCSNQTRDESANLTMSNNSVTVTAVLESVVFQAKTKLTGYLNDMSLNWFLTEGRAHTST
jgi:hypothetical protein